MQDRALDHALEALRRLRVLLGVPRQPGRVLCNEVGEDVPQFFEIDPARPQDICGRGVVEHRQEKVLHRDEFVLLLASLDEGHVQTDFQFLGDHMSSVPNVLPQSAGMQFACP